jgi:hypothetical protein
MYSGWTMLQGYGQQYEYVQSGFWYYNGSGCMRDFAQQRQDANHAAATIQGACRTDGETHDAWQQYMPSTGHIRSNIDSWNVIEGTFSIFGWARPLQADYLGEVHHVNSDMPGLSSRVTDWSGMQIQFFNDNVFYGTCGNITLYRVNDDGFRWGLAAPSCNHIQVWTSSP